MPFIAEIPAERILGGSYGALYCIVPRDDDTALAVNRIKWESTFDRGVCPQNQEVLYRSEHGEPLLVFSICEEFPDEPNIEVNVTPNGDDTVTWYPVLDEYESIVLPTGLYHYPTMMDFSFFGCIDGLDSPEFGGEGDDFWLPPTDLGLDNSDWVFEDWYIELRMNDSTPGYAGSVQIFLQPAHAKPYDLLYGGQWRMEGDNLRLELSMDGNVWSREAFPVLIDPSGDYLYIQQAQNGQCPPFFPEDTTCLTLARAYG